MVSLDGGAVSLDGDRLVRLRRTMASMDVTAILTADPINIVYATGARNMTVFSMMGASRFALVTADGPVVMWEFAGAEHLVAESETITDVRTAPGITAVSGPSHHGAIDRFAADVAELLADVSPAERRLAVERFDHPVTDALRATGLELTSATDVFVVARSIKLPAEVAAMRDAMSSMIETVETMRRQIEPGKSEVEVWAELHRGLIADNGEYVSTRLVQTGQRTFPYFNEAGTTEIRDGDLFCVDTDAMGRLGYGVDFSRTFVCGDATPTSVQTTLHGLAREQLLHNAALIEPGRSFESFARAAWTVPDRYRPYGYYCLAHGLGLCGEYPYVPLDEPGQSYPLPGNFEPGMVICVESYIGDSGSHQGVKLEDQYLITETGAALMSTMPHGMTA